MPAYPLRRFGLNRLETDRYDRVSAAIISGLILTSTVVLVLSAVWWSRRPTDTLPNIITHVDKYTITREKVVPFPSEVTLDHEELQNEFVSNEVSFENLAEQIESISADVVGDGNLGGEIGVDSDVHTTVCVVPEPEQKLSQWDIRFSFRDQAEYARQLDFFGIELAAIGGGIPTIDYAIDFTNSTRTRSGKREAENRYHVIWQTPKQRQSDLDLLAEAGITTENRVPVQFFPKELERTLIGLEHKYADGRSIELIEKTVFEVKRHSGGYKFEVVDQTYAVDTLFE